MAGSEKSERKEEEKEEGEEIEEKSEAQKKPLVDKAQKHNLLFVSERKEEEVKEKGIKRNKSPRARQFLGRSGRWLFFLLILMQKWFCVDAAAVRLEPKGEAEVPEIIIVSDAMDGTFVDLDGKSYHDMHEEKHPRELHFAEWFSVEQPTVTLGSCGSRRSRSQVTKEELPKLGRGCVSSWCTSGIRKGGRRELKHCWKQF